MKKSHSSRRKETALPFDFLDYLCAEHGIQRVAASALLGEWVLALHQGRFRRERRLPGAGSSS
jgi:hypothetical protein